MPTLHLRNVDKETFDRFNQGARARGMTQTEFLSRLVALHRDMRNLADTAWANEPDPERNHEVHVMWSLNKSMLTLTLTNLGMETVDA